MAAQSLGPKATIVREFLVAVVSGAEDHLPTYGEVAAAVGCPPMSLGRLLDEVLADCKRRNEPDLTAIVVNARSRLPGKFKGMRTDLQPPDVASWRQEVQKVRI